MELAKQLMKIESERFIEIAQAYKHLKSLSETDINNDREEETQAGPKESSQEYYRPMSE
jgi:hypothetical protein